MINNYKEKLHDFKYLIPAKTANLPPPSGDADCLVIFKQFSYLANTKPGPFTNYQGLLLQTHGTQG